MDAFRHVGLAKRYECWGLEEQQQAADFIEHLLLELVRMAEVANLKNVQKSAALAYYDAFLTNQHLKDDLSKQRSGDAMDQ